MKNLIAADFETPERVLLNTLKTTVDKNIEAIFSSKNSQLNSYVEFIDISIEDINISFIIKEIIDYFRLQIYLRSDEKSEFEYIFLQARLRSSVPLWAKFGLARLTPEKGWTWIKECTTDIEIREAWADFVFVWPRQIVPGDELCLMFQFSQEARLDIARLTAVHHATSRIIHPQALLMGVGPSVLPSADPDSLMVVSLGEGSRSCYLLVGTAAETPAALPALSFCSRTAKGDEPLRTESLPLGRGLALLRLFAPRHPGELILKRSAHGPDMTLPMRFADQPDLHASARTVHHHQGVLSVKVLLQSTQPQQFAGLFADLLAGELVLQRGQISGVANELLCLDVVCPSRTAQTGLSLKIPALDLVLALPSPTEAPPQDGPLVSELIPFADAVQGSFEGLQPNRRGVAVLKGWARDPARPGSALAVDLFLDDVLLATTFAANARLNVAARHKGSSVAGFSLDLPANIARGESVTVTARARARSGELANATQVIRLPPFGYAPIEDGEAVRPELMQPQAGSPCSCAAIILTQDGADILDDLLASIVIFEPDSFRRIVIIDHDSTDDTAAVIAAYSRRLPLIHRLRPQGSSYAESNNFGASLCDEDMLFFLNNDIVLTAPIVSELCAHRGRHIGAIGCRLNDPPLPGSAPRIEATQHVGIHLETTSHGPVRPFESRILTDLLAANRSPVATPAVTAACMAMARQHFEALNGFDERFYYGWEDVDLCLRALAAGLRNVCVNSAAATHLRSFSRRQMPPGLVERRSRNPETFNQRWSFALRAALRRDELAAPGF